MSAATEQQNNGEAAVEKITADAVDARSAVKANLKQPAIVKPSAPAKAADNGTESKEAAVAEEEEADATNVTALLKEHVKGTKRPADAKSSDTKKAKKDKAADSDSDEDEVLEEIIEGDSEIETDEYDIPYDGEEDDIECDDDDDENDEGSGSDDQA